MAASNVLETFYILFDSNGNVLRQGYQEAEQQANRLQGTLNAADEAGALLGDHLVSTFKNLAIAAAAFFSIDAVKDMILGTAQLNAQLGITAERLGISVEDLDAWGRATAHAGGSAEGFTQTLDFLNRGIADIATKGTSRLKPFFDELKVRVTDGPHQVRPLLDILGDLADKLQGLSAQQRSGIAEKLGIDEGTVLMLAQGRRGVEDLVQRQKDLGTVSEKNTEQAHHYEQAVEDLQTRFHLLGTAISGSALPAIESIFTGIGRFIDFLSEHKTLVEGFFIGAAGAITLYYLPAITEAAAATLIAIAPYVAFAAVVLGIGAAFGFLYDDIKNFLAGNKSVIGELSKSYPELGEAVRAWAGAIKGYFEFLWDSVSSGATLVESVLGFLGALFTKAGGIVGGVAREFVKEWVEAFPQLTSIFKGIGEAIEWLGGVIKSVFGWIFDAVKSIPKAFGHWADDINKETDKIRPPGSKPGTPQATPSPAHQAAQEAPAQPGSVAAAFSPAHLSRAVQGAQNALHQANSSPLNSIAATGGDRRAGRAVTIKVDNINIQTPSTDPAEHGRLVADHLENQVRQAIAHYDDGVQS